MESRNAGIALFSLFGVASIVLKLISGSHPSENADSAHHDGKKSSEANLLSPQAQCVKITSSDNLPIEIKFDETISTVADELPSSDVRELSPFTSTTNQDQDQDHLTHRKEMSNRSESSSDYEVSNIT